ncbi:sec-independent protein translocase protein TATB, chloroplastic-like isoform X1 [Musa acuminata AAA Group]|uniref:sec-independent protein translocase protein TATB, chloroplastic-like isoform X1 n=1 Tax=Musa acuminata AAA Group TaxID=214697 RepID=UPI0031D6EEC5
MGAATLSPAACCHCCSSSSRPKASALLIASPRCVRICPKRSPLSHLLRSIPGLGPGLLSPWSGLKQLGSFVPPRKHARKDKGNCHGKVVYASLFGVGAPEALVIGVVALLVFGPKGLAEATRNLGKTLRAFQPTIRELQDVSREFKSTLEREIGLDEVASSTNYINKSALYADEKQQASVDPNGKPSTGSYTSEELLKVTEEQLTASAAVSQAEAPTPAEQPQESTSETLAATTLEETNPTQADAQVQSSEKAENQK